MAELQDEANDIRAQKAKAPTCNLCGGSGLHDTEIGQAYCRCTKGLMKFESDRLGRAKSTNLLPCGLTKPE